MKKQEVMQYDVAVIGGGPAGMIAAGRAAECGARVVLIEKNHSLGKKLLMTGGGRCNITNTEPDTRKFLSAFKDADKFLFSPFSKFSVVDTLAFFEKYGCPTKVETENRAFPQSDSAKTVLEALLKYTKEGRVHVLTNSSVVRLHDEDGKIKEVVLDGGSRIQASSFILATGGTSHPHTGSTGEGLEWLERLGHTVRTKGIALVPVKTKEAWSHSFQGVSFPMIKMSVIQNDKTILTKKGKLLFTHYGLSGPMVLNASKEIADSFSYGEIVISLDLFPTLDGGTLDRNVQELFKINQNKKFKNALGELIPPKMHSEFIKLTGVEEDRFINKVSREERLRLTSLLKSLKMTVVGFVDDSEAIVASGGVDLKEVDTRTMQSKKIPNLYLTGDILDINRPSGGYSLQLCWTTGYVAGESSVKNK